MNARGECRAPVFADAGPVGGRELRRADFLGALVFLLLACSLAVPYRSRWAYHWDAAQFALAIRHYNPAISQPQPPGYYLYVMLGRAVNWFRGDPHDSLVWLSVAAGGGLAAVVYLLGVSMFGTRAGILAALFCLSSPQVWFHSCVALMYVVDALFVCVLIGWCWRSIIRGGTWSDALVLGAMGGVVAGIRPQTAVGLGGVCLFTIWQVRDRRWKKLAAAVAVAIAVSAAWYVPMVIDSGGSSVYWEAVRRINRLNAPRTLAGGGWEALLQNITRMGIYCWNGMPLGGIALVIGLGYRTFMLDASQKLRWDHFPARAIGLLAAWIVPMIFLGTAVLFTLQPGQVLSYLPGLILLAAATVDRLRRPWACAAVASAICLVNVMIFLGVPRSSDRLFWHLGRNARLIARHDQELSRIVRLLESRYRPQDVVVCHAPAEHFLFGFRLFQLHAPEFDHYQMPADPTLIAPAGCPILCARHGRTEFAARMDLAGKHTVLLVVPPGMTLRAFERYFRVSDAVPVPGSDGFLYALPVSAIRRSNGESGGRAPGAAGSGEKER